jgi:3-oxoadipate enol-lactonase/4-carboxymuconolactone decarboxylase
MATSADALEGNAATARALASGFVRYFGFGPIAKRAIKTMYGPAYLSHPEHSAAALAYVKGLPKSLWRPLAAVIDRPSVAHELARITVPTLVMVGMSDTLLPPPNSYRLAAGIPHAKLVKIPGTGHLITDENPSAATAAIASFLASLGRSSKGTEFSFAASGD